MRQGLRCTAAMLGAVAFVLAAAPAARAQNVFFEGFTNACIPGIFQSSCTPESNDVSGTDKIQNVTYTNTHFSGTSAGWDTPLQLNFGTLNLASAFAAGYDRDFFLRVTFTSPLNSSQIFSADLFGRMLFGEGYATVTFGGGPPYFGANNEYSIWVDDLMLGKGNINNWSFHEPNQATLHGYVMAAAPLTVTPEPVSMALLGTGLAGVVGARRRKKQAVK